MPLAWLGRNAASSRMSGGVPDRCPPAAGSSRRYWPRSGLRVRRVRRGFGGSPSPGSPAPAAGSARGSPGQLLACPAAARICPTPRDQRAVPTTDRFGPDEDAAPPVARQQPGERGQEDSISRPAVRPSNLPAQHRELVTQEKDLNLVRGLRPATQHDQPDEMTEQPVQARDDHADPVTPRRGRIEFPAPARRTNKCRCVYSASNRAAAVPAIPLLVRAGGNGRYWARTSDPQLVDSAHGTMHNCRDARHGMNTRFWFSVVSADVCPLVAER